MGYSSELEEAQAILDVSPKASAALSRRLLQLLLREHYKVRPSDLNNEIQEFLGARNLPTYLGDMVDVIRVVGNFAAHPLKIQNTGEVVEVDPGEADWLIEVLHELLEWTFVQPIRTSEKISRLNAKLAALGKPQLRQVRELGDAE